MRERLRIWSRHEPPNVLPRVNNQSLETHQAQWQTLSPQLEGISTLPRVEFADFNDPLQKLAHMINIDARLQLLKKLAAPEWYLEANNIKDTRSSWPHGFFFDHQGRVLARVDVSTGIISFANLIAIGQMVPMEGNKPLHRIKSYAHQSLYTPFPPIIVEQDEEGRLLVINGHHRRLAALQQGLTHLAAWLICTDVHGDKLKVPKSRDEDYFHAWYHGDQIQLSGVNLAQRLLAALRQTDTKCELP